MPISRQAIRDAEDAVGNDVTELDISNALAQYQELTTTQLKAKLKRMETTFEDAGCRGVELADEIDAARIALAVRPYLPKG
jgi:hypothetical protein